MPVIVDEVPRSLSNPALILATANRSGLFRITGLTFMGGVANTGNNFDGVIRIYGNCWQCRVDHCAFTNLHGSQLAFNGWHYGVVDHNSFVASFEIGILVWMPVYGGYNYGDGSWADDERLGSTNVICIEDNLFVEALNDPGLSANAIDTCYGARTVFHHNVCIRSAATTHGTESTGRGRSFRTLEIYNNTMIGNAECSPIGTFRGGTGLIYSNTF